MSRIRKAIGALLLSFAVGCSKAAASPDAGTLSPATRSSSHGPLDAALEPSHSAGPLRDVLMVGNSVAGTVSFIDPETFENLGAVNVVPDMQARLDAINSDLVRAVAYPIVKFQQLLHHFEPGDGERFVDDVFTSPDGTVLYVSRSNLGDVAAFELTKPGQPLLWRSDVDGLKADHATISPDGTRLVVSATTATVADVFDAKTGKIVGTFETGMYPHQNDYSADGRSIYNSSIGNVGYGLIPHSLNAFKGDRWLVKADAQTLQVQKAWVFDYGIRPSVISADETIMYAQLSYLNGVIKYDLVNSREVARSEQPLSAFALETYADYDEYPHDSAHHGLALSGDGKHLCDCGTIDNNVAIVRAEDMQVEAMIEVGLVPYWATTSPNGRHCFVSLSGDDAVSVIDYETKRQVKVIPTGKFPQRSRLGKIPSGALKLLMSMNG